MTSSIPRARRHDRGGRVAGPLVTRVVVLVMLVLGAAWYLALPPRAASLPPLPAGVAMPPRGAIHVHTRRSDGTGTPEDVAAAAARAGLNFVILTDHGDGTLPPEPPVYRGGVLCIDAVEISTEGGHVLALGLSAGAVPARRRAARRHRRHRAPRRLRDRGASRIGQAGTAMDRLVGADSAVSNGSTPTASGGTNRPGRSSARSSPIRHGRRSRWSRCSTGRMR